jgi:Patatin-like phospholipase
MTDTSENASPRVFGPGMYIPFLARVPVLVSLVLVVTLSDLAIPGSMQEALRYWILDRPHQLFVVAGALLLACLALRFTAEAMIELVSPEFYDSTGSVHAFAHILPRLFSVALGLATATPLLKLEFDTRALPSGRARLIAAGVGLLCILIGLGVAALPKGPHAPTFSLRRTNFVMRWGYALLPLALAVAFAGAVLGLWQQNSGTADHALERYVTAIVGTVDDGSQPNGALQAYVHDSSGESVMRYAPYIKTSHYATSTVSPLLVVAELASLFASCIVARLAIAIFFDLMFPSFGGGGGGSGRFVRAWLPRLASAGLGIGVGAQTLHAYFQPSVVLARNEVYWVWGIAATYAAIGLLASLGSGSAYLASGPWRDSPSVGRRFLGAARRLSSLDSRWQWFIGGLVLVGAAVFMMFADLHFVRIAQWVGPVGIILLWGFTASALFFPLAYLSHMTRIPTLTILLLAALTFAGFDLNDNHELRVVRDKNMAALTAPSKAASAIQSDQRQDLDLSSWIASRQDWNQYDRYPVFLIATEGGGIRAAYFTASVLAALQERCPALAQHTLAISGVSGGSVGAAVFAGLSADYASNVANPGCNLDGMKSPGPVVKRARSVLSTDLLSPLLGAMLFPDALQRIVPVPIPQADRSRAIEYALEDSWRQSTVDDCGRCDRQRMAERAIDLYGRPAPENAVPNLFLNTTEADTGRIIPYTTARVQELATPFRDQAEIDDRNFDSVEPSASQIERLSLQDRMTDDRIPLSTAAIVSARFPYLTPAGRIGYSGGDYVDGGYFENSGTWLLSGLVQYLIGQQASYPAGKTPQLDAARKAVFVVVIIESEPCTRDSIEAGCDEDATSVDGSWNEALSPLRALLSTRDMRAEYSLDGLNAVSALIEQFSTRSGGQPNTTDAGTGCDYPVCAVTLRFRNQTHTDIPLSWVLSSEGRRSMDNAVNGMETANVRLASPPEATESSDDTQDIDRVLGSYRRVLCMLAQRSGSQGCSQQSAAAAVQKSVNK